LSPKLNQLINYLDKTTTTSIYISFRLLSNFFRC